MSKRKEKLLLRWSIIGIIALIFLNGFFDFSPKSENLIVKGSTSVEPFMKAIKNEYSSKYNLALSAQGSGTGITSIFDKKADVAMSSRDLKPEEEKVAKEKHINVNKVAIDGISVIVNKKLKITNLTKEQLSDIYSGKIKNWNQINKEINLPINLIARDEASGTREGFDHILKIKNIPGNAKQIESTGEVIRTVEENEGSIAYISSGTKLTEDVKVLALDNILPTEENIKVSKYELLRNFYLLNYENDNKAVEFIKFVCSSDGQKLLKSDKYRTNFISIIK